MGTFGKQQQQQNENPVSSLGELSSCLGGSDYVAGTVTCGPALNRSSHGHVESPPDTRPLCQ